LSCHDAENAVSS